jgi:hypothetical protein
MEEFTGFRCWERSVLAFRTQGPRRDHWNINPTHRRAALHQSSAAARFEVAVFRCACSPSPFRTILSSRFAFALVRRSGRTVGVPREPRDSPAFRRWTNVTSKFKADVSSWCGVALRNAQRPGSPSRLHFQFHAGVADNDSRR